MKNERLSTEYFFTFFSALCDWPEHALSDPNSLCEDENAVYTGCGGEISCSNVTDCSSDTCTDDDQDVAISEGKR